ncbi:hypothetical protein [Streptomyces sp. NPDC088746]
MRYPILGVTGARYERESALGLGLTPDDVLGLLTAEAAEGLSRS